MQLSMNHWLVYIDGSDITIPPELFPTSTSETAPSTSDNFFSIPLHPISAMPSLPSFPFLEAVRSGSTGNLSTQNLPSIPETVPFESSHAIGKRKRSGNDNKKVTSSKNSIDDTTSSSMEVSGDVDEFVDHAPMIEDDTDKSVLQEQALELKQSSYLAVSAFTESTQKQSKQVKPTTKTVASSSRSKINGPVSVKFNDKADMRLNQMKPASTHGNRRLSMRSNK